MCEPDLKYFLSYLRWTHTFSSCLANRYSSRPSHIHACSDHASVCVCSQWGEGGRLLPETSVGGLSPLRSKESSIEIQHVQHHLSGESQTPPYTLDGWLVLLKLGTAAFIYMGIFTASCTSVVLKSLDQATDIPAKPPYPGIYS